MIPQVLRSWQHLAQPKPGYVPGSLPIAPGGTTYSMVQELAWIDTEHFAVGRWDGSLSVFRFTDSANQGPLITRAVNAPSAEGLQMLTWIAPGAFVSSNDESSLLLWRSASGQWSDVAIAQQLQFDPRLGVANSGTSYVIPSSVPQTLYLLVGHAGGYLSMWSGPATGTSLSFVRSVDLRSAHPVNPWGLHNIRGTAMIAWDATSGYVVTGSEDGDLCVVRVPDGAVLSRTVYSPIAQRGINSIATFGDQLLVANCAVGPDDYNLWYYAIDRSTWTIAQRAATMLRVNPNLPQVFNFDVIWGWADGSPCWFASTEEGYLWMGTTGIDGFSVIGNQQVTSSLGAAIGMSARGGIALAAYDLYEFTTGMKGTLCVDGHPERFGAP